MDLIQGDWSYHSQWIRSMIQLGVLMAYAVGFSKRLHQLGAVLHRLEMMFKVTLSKIIRTNARGGVY